MKKYLLFFGLLLVLLTACSGSETYRGSWKAIDKDGNKFEIDFNAKRFSITDSSGEKEKYDYTQNSVNIENGVETYGIQLEDGRKYQITFPNSEDQDSGFISDGNNVPMYTIGRKDFVKYDDVYKLK